LFGGASKRPIVRATFALLANTEIHNLVRKWTWELHQKYRTGTRHASLPPHISLRQPFRIKDIVELEGYMAELAGSIHPFEAKLTELQIEPLLHEGIEYGILWIDVQETEYLRSLHNRAIVELSQRFGYTQAAFDGNDYHFHMTVNMGGQPIDVYRKFLGEIPETELNLSFTVRELALFVYDEPMGPAGDYLSYKILPIGKS
jgi:2'-5' RNA ligase